jgi:hypothetical protein
MGYMAPSYRTADGWSVEVVRLACIPNRHDGEWIRVRHYEYFVADARSVEALESYFALVDLEEALMGRMLRRTYSNQPWSPLSRCSWTARRPSSW